METKDVSLTTEVKRDVLARVLKTLAAKFYKPELLGSTWQNAVARHRMQIEEAPTQEIFEAAVSDLLKTLGVSHVGFWHGSAKRASSRAALSATYLKENTQHGERWVFQDVHEGGAASLAGVEPGNILLEVNGKAVLPPEHPVFSMGSTSTLIVVANDSETRTVTVNVAQPKGRKLQYVEPTLVQSRRLDQSIGYLKVTMFPGMLGVDVANAMSAAVAELGNVGGLVIDLRGNTGGGAGALRLMSLLTPDGIPVGFAPGKRWAGRDLVAEKERLPRLNSIPDKKGGLWLLGLCFLPSLLIGTPVVLETEKLGPKPFHGHIVLLVDRHTASAAEMVTIFARENGLATIVGEETAGRLLSATSTKVGHGFRLAFPTGAYYTWQLTALEGKPIQPDVVASFNWEERRGGTDTMLNAAMAVLQN